MQALLLSVSTILVIVGPSIYILSIARGNSKPHRMTRFILFFVLTLNFVSIVAAHGNTGAILFAGISFFQATIIFFLSIWRGMGGASRFDYMCLVIALLGVLGWKLTGNPIIGMWFSVIADFSAYLPAFVKTWKHPKTESPWYYFLSGSAALVSLLAYTLDISSLFQMYIVLSSFVMVGFIYHKAILTTLK